MYFPYPLYVLLFVSLNLGTPNGFSKILIGQELLIYVEFNMEEKLVFTVLIVYKSVSHSCTVNYLIL